MYGIPEGVSWDLLLGKSVERIGIGRYCTSIFLDDGCISIEGNFSVSYDSKTINGSGEDPDTSAVLVKLLGLEVHSVTVVNSTTLEICFDFLTLRLYDNKDNFESFRITVFSLDIVV